MWTVRQIARVFQSSPSSNPLFFLSFLFRLCYSAVIINKSRRSIHNRVQCIYYFSFYFSVCFCCCFIIFYFLCRVFHYSLLHCSIQLDSLSLFLSLCVFFIHIFSCSCLSFFRSIRCALFFCRIRLLLFFSLISYTVILPALQSNYSPTYYIILYIMRIYAMNTLFISNTLDI